MTVTVDRYKLALPWARPPLTANQRLNWRARSKLTAEVRTTVAWLARAANIAPGKHLTVGLVWAPGDKRRRDSDNLNPTLKVAIDSLARGPRKDWVGLEIVPDDTDVYVTRTPPRIVPPPHPRGMWLTVEVIR